MTVLVDGLNFNGYMHADWCHLVSDASQEELHAFAQRLGLRRKWFQDDLVQHYEIRGSALRDKAISLGAVPVTTRDLVTRVIGG